MSDLSKVSAQELVERVAREVARRFDRNLPMASGSHPVGPPFCAACDVAGQCVKKCADAGSAVQQAGADRIGAAPGIGELDARIARMIDHTLLKPSATRDQIEFLCAEAAKYGFKSVCVNPFWVPYCAKLLGGHQVEVCTVIGFPLGANQPQVKATEARLAVEQGATEVDMVINVGALKSGMFDVVEEDIRAVREGAGSGVVLKVILETALLDDHQKVAGCEASVRAGADFVKTSTGFGGGGATAGDVALMRRVVGEGLGVKASGGVRNRKDAVLMMDSGASRIGASAGVKIMNEVRGLGSGVKQATRAAPSSSGGY